MTYGHYDDANREYVIRVSNPNGRQKGVATVTVDGAPVNGNVIPYTPGTHTVDVIM